MALSIYTKTCAKNVAGNNAVLVTEASNIDTVTVDGSGEITAITMVGGATFKQLQADQDSIARLEEAAGSEYSISYTHSVQMGFAKASVNLNTLRDSLAAASPCGIVAIVQDSNGKSWMVGYNEVDLLKRALRLVTDSYTSGNSPADEDVQKADVILESISGYTDLPLDSDLNSALTAALAAGGGTAIEWSPESYGPELHVSANAASDPNGNEADAITGWTPTSLNGTGANVFESQSSIVNTGAYAFHAECNDTPTSGAKINWSPVVDDGATYRLMFDWRHVGTGGGWSLKVEGATEASIANTQTSFESVDVEVLAVGGNLTIDIIEGALSNDGGVYVDNISLKKKL